MGMGVLVGVIVGSGVLVGEGSALLQADNKATLKNHKTFTLVMYSTPHKIYRIIDTQKQDDTIL